MKTWSILKDSISTSQLVLGLYLKFYLFWPTKTGKSPTSKGCNLRRDPQHATGPMCWYRKTVAQDVRKSKESPHPVLSCDVYQPKNEKMMWIYKEFQNKCLKLSSNTPIQVKLRMSHDHLSLHHVARKILPPMTSWLVTFGSWGKFPSPGSRRPSEIDSRPQRLTCWKKWCQNWNYPFQAGRRTKSILLKGRWVTWG